MTQKKNEGNWQAPKECFACGSIDSYHRELTSSTKSIRGEQYEISHHHWKCAKCGFAVLGAPEMDEAMRAVVTAYQEGHGLLTARAIQDSRKRMQWSQRELSTRSKVGVATIKRIESGSIVQTNSVNSAILDALGESLNAPFEFLVIDCLGVRCSYMTEIWEEGWEEVRRSATIIKSDRGFSRVFGYKNYCTSC